ncbi:MAG: isochorismate synthase [Actinobacteria bacterium]|nr:isochorismate synthase [Actinomycetota bacterium]
MTGPLRARTWELPDAGALLDHLPAATAGVAWLQGDDGLVGWGEAARLGTDGPDRFADAERGVAALLADAEVEDEVGVPGTGVVTFGTFTFDARSTGSALVVPAVVVGRRGAAAWVTAVTADGSVPVRPVLEPRTVTGDEAADRPRYAGSSMPDVHWLEAVAGAVERIRDGELDKVVLARDHAVWSRAPFDPRVLARRLNRRFPGCATFVVDGLVGATPELLVRRFGPEVESLALAGTARRGLDDAEDRRLGEALLASAKDRWEHELAATTVAEVLGPRCATLEHPDGPELLRLDNVMHLATRFRGTLAAPAATSLELVGALHPTAAVGGVPRDRAVELIREVEGMDRGRYAAPVGWTDGDGDGEWGIALRCAELSGARARLFAGAGIVADSLPEDELEETRVKLRAMQSAFEAPDDLMPPRPG